MSDSLYIASKNVWLCSIANTRLCILEIQNDDINFEFFLKIESGLHSEGY